MSTQEIRHPAGEFKPSAPTQERPRSPKHQLGVKATPADNTEEFQAETLPPGSAPRQNTFKPQPTEDDIPSRSTEGASATLMGATSADVNKGLGKPMAGQTSTEERHEGEHHRKRQGAGLEGVGANPEGTATDMGRLERDD